MVRAAAVALGVVAETGAAGVGVGTGVTLLSTLELRDWMGDSGSGGGGGGGGGGDAVGTGMGGGVTTHSASAASRGLMAMASQPMAAVDATSCYRTTRGTTVTRVTAPGYEHANTTKYEHEAREARW